MRFRNDLETEKKFEVALNPLQIIFFNFASFTRAC